MGMETERLYYKDCYLREFDATVARAEPAPVGFRVYLDRTAFYPNSGGQPSDRGSIGGVQVLEVVDEGVFIAHITGRLPETGRVQCIIDWTRRFDHMQQHTGQHILSAAFEETAQRKTVSFHLGSETSIIDLDSDRLSPRLIEASEDLANRVVFEDRPVNILFREAEDARRMGLRKETGREGNVRLIEVEHFDLSACGGTHVNRTGGVGLIAARKFERLKGQSRVEFVCGGRALRSMRADYHSLDEAARVLSCSLEAVPARVKQQIDELRGTLRNTEKLIRRMAEYRALELARDAPLRNELKVIRHIFNAEENLEAKFVAHAAASMEGCVALLGVKGKPATLYFSRAPGIAQDMGIILKRILQAFGGKGGGSPSFAQGGGLSDEKLKEALDHAESLLSQFVEKP